MKKGENLSAVELGKRLAMMRLNRGLSMSEAADAIGHSVDFLAHLESGLHSMSPETLRQLEALYEQSIDLEP